MNYELALKLKDAGFPHITTSSGKIWIGEDWQSPTLSELIEECGEHFISLDRIDGGWRATGMKDSLIFCDNSIPIEAVAKLWLALNSKEK